MNFYPYLLRQENSKQFGVNLSNIIPVKRKRSMSKKLVVFFNDEEQEPIEVANIDIQINNDTIVLRINSKNVTQNTTETALDTPSVDGIVASHVEEKFLLKGEDLESFETLSELRNNRATKQKGITPIQHIIETQVFNIQDIQSVDQATMELLNAEQKLINSGYKMLEVNTPEFIFEEDAEHFKLIETCILCQIKESEKQST